MIDLVREADMFNQSQYMIEADNLTKDYKHGRGVFDVTFGVRMGEIFGLLGPNGAGKTTIIRHLLGFLKSDSGVAKICGQNSRVAFPTDIVGYLPGEISIPNELSAKYYLNALAKMRGLKDLSKMKKLIERFELDTNIQIKKMSKGTKQKVAIVAAFMHDPAILILDEPTSGLDPIMQNELIKLVLEEKEKGKTILFASHIFDEVEKTCDNICFLKNGKMVDSMPLEQIRNLKYSVYELKFESEREAGDFAASNDTFLSLHDSDSVVFKVTNSRLNEFIKAISSSKIVALHEQPPTLEDFFMQIYSKERNDENG